MKNSITPGDLVSPLAEKKAYVCRVANAIWCAQDPSHRMRFMVCASHPGVEDDILDVEGVDEYISMKDLIEWLPEDVRKNFSL